MEVLSHYFGYQNEPRCLNSTFNDFYRVVIFKKKKKVKAKKEVKKCWPGNTGAAAFVCSLGWSEGARVRNPSVTTCSFAY